MMKEETGSRSLFSPDKERIAFFFVLALAALLLFFRLGERPLRNPDEGRYALAAWEMLQSGDWIRPTLYGLAYLKKPALFYWLVALSMKIFGETVWAARLVPVLFSLLSVAATYAFARRHYGVETALFSALILATNFWFVQVGRFLVIDAVFSFFLTASFFCFYNSMALKEKKERWLLLFYVSLGMAFLAKGFLAPALAVFCLSLFAVLSGQVRKILAEISLFRGILLFSALALPWYIVMERREPGFIRFFFGHENWKRFFSEDFAHQEPWYYYGLLLVLVLLPWTFFAGAWKKALEGLRSGERRQDPRLFLTVTALGMAFVLSLSRSKMPTYILPCLPLFAVLLGYGWREWIRSGGIPERWERFGVFFVFFLGIGFLAGGPFYVSLYPGRFPAQISQDLQILGGSAIVGAFICLRPLRQKNAGRLFFSLLFASALVSWPFAYVMETMNPTYSAHAFAEALKGSLRPGEEIYVYGNPGAFHDFAFNLKSPVKLVGLEGELEFSRGEETAKKISVDKQSFESYLEEGRALVCLIRRSEFGNLGAAARSRARILKEDDRKILFRAGNPS